MTGYLSRGVLVSTQRERVRERGPFTRDNPSRSPWSGRAPAWATALHPERQLYARDGPEGHLSSGVRYKRHYPVNLLTYLYIKHRTSLTIFNANGGHNLYHHFAEIEIRLHRLGNQQLYDVTT